MLVISFPLQCTGCGAYLQNTDSASDCPFCGAPTANSLRIVGIDPETMLVNEDVLCRQCNYNLRTSPVTGLCPECGQPVALSLRPDALRTANPEWIRKVRSGATLLLLVATMGVFLTFLLPMTLGIFLALGTARGVGGFVVFFALISLTVMVMYFLSLFRITASDPSTTSRESAAPRVLARVCSLLPLGLMPVSWILVYQHRSTWMTNPTASMTSMIVIGCISWLLFGIGLAAVAACLRRIFDRASQHSSRKLTTVLIWLTLLATLGLGVGTTMQQIASRRMLAAMRPMIPAGTTTAPGMVFTTTSPYSYSTGTVTSYGPSGVITSTTVATKAPAVMPPGPKMLAALIVPMIINCVSFLGALTCYVMWIIVLIRVRRLLAKRLPGVS